MINMNNYKLEEMKKQDRLVSFSLGIFIFLFFATIFIITFILPSFKNVFGGVEKSPLPRLLFIISDFMQEYFLVLVAATIIIYFPFKTKWKMLFGYIKQKLNPKVSFVISIVALLLFFCFIVWAIFRPLPGVLILH